MTTKALTFERVAGWYLVPRASGGYISHYVQGNQQRGLCGVSMVFGRVRSGEAVASCKRCLHIYNHCCPMCHRRIKADDAVRYDIINNRAYHWACATRGTNGK